MALIASLGMYDDPFLQPANDQLWQEIRHSITNLNSGIDAPEKLNRIMSLADQWRSPDLLLSQTCGFPYIAKYQQYLQLVATPVYTHPGCSDTNYSSFLIASRNAPTQLPDYRGKKLAANSVDSLSGYVSLQIALDDADLGLPFFSHCLFCTAHASSIKLVSTGQADLCCIDAVTWSLLCNDQPGLNDTLQVIGRTRQFPALPLVTSTASSQATTATLRSALEQLTQNVHARSALERIGIHSFKPVAHHEYQQILERYEQANHSPIADSTTTVRL